jgi:hypothetical protein
VNAELIYGAMPDQANSTDVLASVTVAACVARSAAMRFYDEQIEVGAVIESGTYDVWRVEQPSHADGLGHAWARLVAV